MGLLYHEFMGAGTEVIVRSLSIRTATQTQGQPHDHTGQPGRCEVSRSGAGPDYSQSGRLVAALKAKNQWSDDHRSPDCCLITWRKSEVMGLGDPAA